MPSIDIVGFLVSASCEPVQGDWAHRPIILSEQIGPILPEPPTYHSLLEENGVGNKYSDGVSSIRRRDRVDMKCEEITFVNVYFFYGSMKFEVYDRKHCISRGF